jgi:hypothetical protein
MEGEKPGRDGTESRAVRHDERQQSGPVDPVGADASDAGYLDCAHIRKSLSSFHSS